MFQMLTVSVKLFKNRKGSQFFCRLFVSWCIYICTFVCSVPKKPGSAVCLFYSCSILLKILKLIFPHTVLLMLDLWCRHLEDEGLLFHWKYRNILQCCSRLKIQKKSRTCQILSKLSLSFKLKYKPSQKASQFLHQNNWKKNK